MTSTNFRAASAALFFAALKLRLLRRFLRKPHHAGWKLGSGRLEQPGGIYDESDIGARPKLFCREGALLKRHEYPIRETVR
jgi:hypothetical protein